MALNNLGINGEVFIEKSYDEAIKRVLRSGLMPSTTKDIVKFRLDSLGKENESLWWENSFYTCDGVVSYGWDKIKILKNSNNIKELKNVVNIKDKYIMGMRCYCVSAPNRVLTMTKEEYEKIESEEFSFTEFEKRYGLVAGLSKEDIKKCPVWIELVEDHDLLAKYVDSVFKVHSERSLPMSHNLMKISFKRGLLDDKAIIYPIYIDSINAFMGSGIYAGELDSQAMVVGIKDYIV